MKNFISFIVFTFTAMNINAQPNIDLFIGTYTHSCDSDGIYVFDFNTVSGEATFKSSTDKIVNPSYLAVSTDSKSVFSVNEAGQKSTITSFKVDVDTRDFQVLNIKSSEGADPCHIISDDKNVVVSNYSGGTISVFGIKSNGSLTDGKQVVQHFGKSINKQRQESPHVHMAQFSPDRKYVLASDLGNDRLYVYRYNADSKDEVLKFHDSIPIKSGSGPRHFAFSPNGKQLYLLQELDGTITVFNYNDGKLNRVQETSVVTNGFSGAIGAAAIKISTDGKFLYATNRGEANTVSVFVIDTKGRLKLVQTISSLGKSPRDLTIDPSGNFVLVAHEKSNQVVIFKRSTATGELTDSGKRINLCAPVCLVFPAK